MGWLVGILLVAVGAVIGFFAARYWILEHSDQADLQAQLDESKQQFEAYKTGRSGSFIYSAAIV